MATKNFDSLFEKLLTELMPVYPGEEGGGTPEEFESELTAGAEKMPGGGYLFGKIQDALGLSSKEEAIRLVAKDLYSKVYPGGVNKANDNDTFRRSIARALQEIVSKISADKGVKIPGAGLAIAGYTSRIVDQLTKSKKEFGGEKGFKASKEEVVAAVEDAAEQEEDGVAAAAPKAPKAPKAARFLEDAEYEILTPDEMSAAGVQLSDDLKTYYSRVENIADQVQLGKDIARAIQRGGTDAGSAVKAASALIRAGAIKYATAETSDQDVEALEREEGDIEEIGRKEFEKSFGKAYKDYLASMPGAERKENYY